MFLLPGCSCCGCKICPYSNSDCLQVTFSGFGGPEEAECHQCDRLNEGTYILHRVDGVEATISARVTATSGCCATFSVTLAQDPEDDHWYIDSLSLTNGGVGYSSDARFDYTITGASVGCDGNSEPVVVLVIGRLAPTLTPSVSNGYGASLSPVMVQIEAEEGSETWGVSGVTVASGGAGYVDGSACTFTIPPLYFQTPSGESSLDGGTTITAASGVVNVVRSEPSVYASVSSESGYGAEIELTLTEQVLSGGKTWWTVTAATIVYGGYGYIESDTIQISATSSVVRLGGGGLSTIAFEVDESGSIISVSLTATDSVYQTSGAIGSITISEETRGEYYRGGSVTSATLVSGGVFWPGGDQRTRDALWERGIYFVGNTVEEYQKTACVYLWQGCSDCDVDFTQSPFRSRLQISLVRGETSDRLLVRQGWQGEWSGATINPAELLFSPNRVVIDATKTRESDSDSISFDASNLASPSGCVTNGTISVEPVACTEDTELPCQMPRQVTLSVSGPGLVSSQSILDLSAACNYYAYDGPFPILPIGTLDPAIPSSTAVTISRAALFTNVTVEPPTKGPGSAATLVPVIEGGVITSVTVQDGGNGYAVEIFERAEPDVTASAPAPPGSGAALTVTLVESEDPPWVGDGPLNFWEVASVAVDSVGTGYVEGAAVTFTVADGDTQDDAAEAILHVTKAIPTLTATGGSGTGVTFTVNLATNGDYWRVDTITKSAGGSGYVDGEYLTIEGSAGDVEVGAASARVRTVRDEPVIDAAVSGSSGTGAVLAVSLTASGGYWSYSSMSITSGGSGYSVDDEIVLVLTDATEYGSEYGSGYGSASVSAVDGSGAITAISASFGRSFFRDTGVIDSVQVMSYGDYYHTDGDIASVEIQDGGRYWGLVPTGSVDSDSPDVFFSSNIGRDASGVAVIDTTPASPSFGRITAITLLDGGTGYKPGGGVGWTLSFSHPDLVALSINEDHPSYTTDQPCPLSLADATYSDQKYRTFDGLEVSIELALAPA